MSFGAWCVKLKLSRFFLQVFDLLGSKPALKMVFDELEVFGFSTPVPKPAPKKGANCGKIRKSASRSVKEALPGRTLYRTEDISPAEWETFPIFTLL